MRSLILLLLFIVASCGVPQLAGGQDTSSFAPESLCKETLGEWIRVDARAYVVNPEQGIFDPDQHPDYNYQCLCLEGMTWSTSGCY